MKTLAFDHKSNANVWPFRHKIIEAIPKAGDQVQFVFDNDPWEADRLRNFLSHWSSQSFEWVESRDVYKTTFTLTKHLDSPILDLSGYVEAPPLPTPRRDTVNE